MLLATFVTEEHLCEGGRPNEEARGLIQVGPQQLVVVGQGGGVQQLPLLEVLHETGSQTDGVHHEPGLVRAPQQGPGQGRGSCQPFLQQD